ncbi:MAG: Arginine-tRNA-protein transferase, partial [Nitrobacter vulgaris]|nr:Arginine-tRNA-protein transferase [Nitrobacter vulgaris]
MTQHSRDTPQFYLTAPSPCPYLPDRSERKVFTHLVGEKAGELNDLLTHGGFRRSQSIAYRPACDQCRACVSVRVLADEFRPSRSARRVLARNADIVGNLRAAMPTSEQYSVFRAYLDQRHR